jgi:membrane protein required for colicin V production
MGWNWLDSAILGILALSTVVAIWEGLIREVISLVALVAGILVAALEYTRVAPWFERWIHPLDFAQGTAFIALFLGVLIAGAVLGFLLRRIALIAGLGWFDRFLGGVFGLVRGFAIVSVLLLATVTFSLKPAAVENSVLAPYVLLGARVVGAALPKDLSARFQSGLDKFRKALIEKDKKALGR